MPTPQPPSPPPLKLLKFLFFELAIHAFIFEALTIFLMPGLTNLSLFETVHFQFFFFFKQSWGKSTQGIFPGGGGGGQFSLLEDGGGGGGGPPPPPPPPPTSCKFAHPPPQLEKSLPYTPNFYSPPTTSQFLSH